jgi:hypothetical protein
VPLKREPAQGHLVLQGDLQHHGAHQVVRNQVHQHFFTDQGSEEPLSTWRAQGGALPAGVGDQQAEVAQLGWIAQGSLLPNPPRSWRLTRKVQAKTVTLALSAAQADAFRQAIANHRRLEDLLHEMRQLSEIALRGSAPGVKKRPRPTRPKPPLT